MSGRDFCTREIFVWVGEKSGEGGGEDKDDEGEGGNEGSGEDDGVECDEDKDREGNFEESSRCIFARFPNAPSVTKCPDFVVVLGILQS